MLRIPDTGKFICGDRLANDAPHRGKHDHHSRYAMRGRRDAPCHRDSDAPYPASGGDVPRVCPAAGVAWRSRGGCLAADAGWNYPDGCPAADVAWCSRGGCPAEGEGWNYPGGCPAAGAAHCSPGGCPDGVCARRPVCAPRGRNDAGDAPDGGGCPGNAQPDNDAALSHDAHDEDNASDHNTTKPDPSRAPGRPPSAPQR